MNERHGFFHLGLGDFRPEGFVVEGEGEGIEGVADHVDVFGLPGGVGCCGEDGEFLGQFGVEGDGFAFFLFFELRGFGGGDAGGCVADVFASGGEMGLGERDGGPESELDG